MIGAIESVNVGNRTKGYRRFSRQNKVTNTPRRPFGIASLCHTSNVNALVLDSNEKLQVVIIC
jgi:hypothetical protein